MSEIFGEMKVFVCKENFIYDEVELNESVRDFFVC